MTRENYLQIQKVLREEGLGEVLTCLALEYGTSAKMLHETIVKEKTDEVNRANMITAALDFVTHLAIDYDHALMTRTDHKQLLVRIYPS